MKKIRLGITFFLIAGLISPFFSIAVYTPLITQGKNFSLNGTVYTVTTENGQAVKRPYTSADAFLSYSFNSWTSVAPADSATLNLPVGSFMPPRDGKIFCSDRAPDKGTCYLISQGQKLGFPSTTIFTAQGFSFKQALYGDVSFLQLGGIITNGSQAHSLGVLINNNGTLQLVGETGLLGFPNPEVLAARGYSFSDAVMANNEDEKLQQTGVMMEYPWKDPFYNGSSTALSLLTSALQTGTNGLAYSQSISATGGSDSYNWSVLAGQLPPGLSLVSAQCVAAPCQVPVTISGMPTATGTYTFTVTVTSGTLTASKDFTIYIN